MKGILKRRSTDFGPWTVCIVLCAFCIGQSSCNNKSGSFTSNTDTLSYTVKEVVVGDTSKTFARITYPYFLDEDEHTGINTFLLHQFTKETKYSSYNDVCSGFVKQYDSLAKEVLDYTQNWTSEQSVKVSYQQYPIISLNNTVYEYTGGAHGNYGTFFINYNCKTQSSIELSDLFNAEQLKELTKIAEKIFRKQEGLKDTDDYSNYFFDNRIFVLPTNFSIRKDGLLFQYGIYEIKPYVDGTTDLFVPYSAISNLIGGEHILKLIIKN